MVLFLRSKKGFRYIPENESEQDILGWNKSPDSLEKSHQARAKLHVLGAEDLSEEALTARVIASGASLDFQISRGLRVFCSTKERREMQRRVPNRRMPSSIVKTMLKPWRKRSSISVRHKSVAVVVRVEV